MHSKFSKRPSEWVLRKLGCSESYSEPTKIYALAKQKGMDFVTVTDHNTLAGSLEIAHHEDAFVSEEITTYFPEDHCKLHVLAYDIDERQHADISRLRESVFELVTYLNQEDIVHALAHPLYAVNDKLNIRHFERCLLLFRNFELNGSRDQYQNTILAEILRGLTEEELLHLADKYDLIPAHSKPWQKGLVGGSDDHSSLNVASMYTEASGMATIKEFLQTVNHGGAEVRGNGSNPRTMAHNIYSIAYQFYKSRFGLGRYISGELLLRFADRALLPAPEEEEGLMDRLRSAIGSRRANQIFRSKPKTTQDLFIKEAREIIFSDPLLHELSEETDKRSVRMEEAWYQFVNQISERVLRRFADSILESLSGANLFDIFHSIGSAGSLYTMLAPYLVGYTLFTRDRQFCRDCHERFRREGSKSACERLKIAHFTDTYHEVNGVALTLQMQVEMARKNKKQLTLITCGPKTDLSQVVNFTPIGTYAMPEYPELKLYYPPVLEMVNYCYEQGFTNIHSATPGPIGLAALAIARILKLPIYSTYHTALPQYASQLTEDNTMEDMMWKYTVWYYSQMDVVYVPSQATGKELVERGMAEEKVRFYPRGVDIDRFNPSKRNGFFGDQFGLDEREFKLLYVGRVSKEKDLHVLVDTFKTLTALRSNIRLVIVGNGPYLEEMHRALGDTPVTFTDFLADEDLAMAYASSDIFLFPSQTDTFGNVVLEAQASGLPVIVTDKGGPKENMIDGTTGLVVPAGDSEAFVRAVLNLKNSPKVLEQMKRDARRFTEKRSFEAAYLRLWESYRNSGN
jgi:glycosyltransferase involved in cell wall biosynthesis